MSLTPVGRSTLHALSAALALLALAIAAPSAFACSCVPTHPAALLAGADAALVGVVESSTPTANGGTTTTIRVERALKGQLAERVTVTTPLTSCSASPAAGTRIGVVFRGAPETWGIATCNLVAPDALIAASQLPPIGGGAPRLLAVFGNTIADSVALDAQGRPTAYGAPVGAPLAAAACGKTALVASRTPGGELLLTERTVPGLQPSGSTRHLAGFGDVSALRCSDDGRQAWVVGTQDGRTIIAEAGSGAVRRLFVTQARAVVALAGEHAYVAARRRVTVVTLATGATRTVRHRGEFAQLSVAGDRVAGRLRDGHGAVLDLATRRLRAGGATGPLVWLTPTRLLDATRGSVLDARLETVSRVRNVKGRVLAVDSGTAYLGDGHLVRRLLPGATRAQAFARLAGDVVALTPAAVTATAADWHSCEKSANTP